MSRDIKKHIVSRAKDLACGFMYYDRKEDEELPRGAIEKAVADGIITYKEIADIFLKELEND